MGGEKLIKYYPDVKKVIGTDYSSAMIKTAISNLKQSKKDNIEFKVMDNLNLSFPDNSIDLISARHTVINSKELFRVLKNNSYVIIQGVDKNDCIELKEIFQRGQAFNDLKSIFQIDLENLLNAGFEIIEQVEIRETEFYKTEKDLMGLLLKTPILNDFSEVNFTNNVIPTEKHLFEKYVDLFTSPRGIRLNRILYGIVAYKN